MKALELEPGLILKEDRRLIYREQNYFIIVFKSNIKYGCVSTESLDKKRATVQIQINKSGNPRLWAKFKDSSTDVLYDFILKEKDYIYPVPDKSLTKEEDLIRESKRIELEPFYDPLFLYLSQFKDIKIIDI